jgi:hypothetical protein
MRKAQGETTGPSDNLFKVQLADIMQIRSALAQTTQVDNNADLDKSGHETSWRPVVIYKMS